MWQSICFKAQHCFIVCFQVNTALEQKNVKIALLNRQLRATKCCIPTNENLANKNKIINAKKANMMNASLARNFTKRTPLASLNRIVTSTPFNDNNALNTPMSATPITRRSSRTKRISKRSKMDFSGLPIAWTTKLMTSIEDNF